MTDWSQPSLSDTYANFLSYVTARDTSLALGLDPATTTVTNPPTNAIRWNSATSRWQKWNGSAWGNLTSAYQIDITGGTGTTLTNPVINGFTGSTAVINIGSGQIYKDTSGNVGIGGTPSYQLDLLSNIDNAVILRQYNANTGASAHLYHLMSAGGRTVSRIVHYAGQYLWEVGSVSGITSRYSYFDTHTWNSNAGTEYGRISSSGNWGLGTSSPGDKLHVEGNIYLGTTSRTIYSGGSANLVHQTNTGAHLWMLANGATEAMRVTTTGLGIGVTAPTQKLDINGTINIGDNNTRLNISAGPSGAFINNVDNSPMYFSTTNVVRATLNSTGLGIGMTPGRKLDVTGLVGVTYNSVSGGALIFVDTNAGGKTWQIGPGAGTGSPTLLGIWNNTNANQILNISSAGALTMTTSVSAGTGVYANGTDGFYLGGTSARLFVSGNYLLLTDTGGLGYALQVGNAADPHNYYNNGSHSFRSRDGTSSYVHINTNGMGIGTTSVSSKLTVVGTIESTSGGVKYPDGATQAASAVWEGEIYGLTLSTAGSSTTFTVAAGAASSSTSGGGRIALAASLAKTTGAWAVGAAAGSLDTGAIANSTWYHAFVIRRPDTGVTNVLISLSATSPTLPTNYTQYRRIGSMQTNGSGQWTSFLQVGDYFYRASSTDVSTGATGYTLVTLSVPSGIVVRPFGTAQVACYGSSGGTHIYLAPASTTTLGNMLVGQVDGSAGSAYIGSYYEGPPTNTSRQVYWAANGVTIYAMLIVSGWIDKRGRIS